MEALDIDWIAETLERVLRQDGRLVRLRDVASWVTLPIPPHVAAAPEGLLPSMLVTGNDLLKAATGQGFRVDLEKDPATLLGYRAVGVSGAPLGVVVLSAMEALDQVAGPDGIMAHELALVRQRARAWQAAASPVEAPPEPAPEPLVAPVPEADSMAAPAPVSTLTPSPAGGPRP